MCFPASQAQSPQCALERALPIPGGHHTRSAYTSSLPLGMRVESPRAPDLNEVLLCSAQSASLAWVSEKQTQNPTGLRGLGQPPGQEPLYPLLVSFDTPLFLASPSPT